MADDVKRVELRIYGKVQGVFYRANTREQARNRGLTGWVENLSDGSVRAVAEGPEERLEELVEWTHEGSPAAQVEDVDAKWKEATGEFDGFTVRR